MNLFLFEDLPLRTTRVLGDFADDAVLAHRYGDLTQARFPLAKLDSVRYFAADHPMPITEVFIDDQPYVSYEASLESDGAGRTWTIVTLGAPAPNGAKVSAAGFGKLNPLTGALLENPADVIEDLMRLCGRSDDWSALRAEASAFGMKVAGSVSVVQPIKDQIDEITASVGAIWSPGMARLYPTTQTPRPIVYLNKLSASDLAISASVDDTADVLRLGYDYSEATGKARHFIELTASPQRFGGLVKELTFRWLRTPADAEVVGRPILQRLAGERYEVAFKSDETTLRPGVWVGLVQHPEWPFDGADPIMMALGVDVIQDSREVDVTAEHMRTIPLVTVTAHSVALPDTATASLEVSTRDGITTLTVHDLADKPIQGARVSLDGGAPKTTDALGQVKYIVPRGKHLFALEAPGHDPIEGEIEV